MSKVHLLEDELINKIAAGEVVERPASVVKELVENAVDAGATFIEVELIDGGKGLISIRDNGSGMVRDDAVMAIKRHCTSKISRLDDLFQIHTMGFRGEALASISAVSRFSMTTRTSQCKEGTKISFEDGDLVVGDWSGEIGTTVAIKDLFFNVPARRSFLKSSSAEFAQCNELMQSLALSLPHVGFVLKHNGREHLRVEPIISKSDQGFGEIVLQKRFRDVLSLKDQKLCYAYAKEKHGDVEALLSPPGFEKSTGKNIFMFVNGRWVKDKNIRFSILRGYHSHLLKGRFPVCALYLKIDTSLVDVNVHPNKAEVRFQYNQEVQSLIALTIRNRLRQGDWARQGAETTSSLSQTSYSPPSQAGTHLKIGKTAHRSQGDSESISSKFLSSKKTDVQARELGHTSNPTMAFGSKSQDIEFEFDLQSNRDLSTKTLQTQNKSKSSDGVSSKSDTIQSSTKPYQPQHLRPSIESFDGMKSAPDKVKSEKRVGSTVPAIFEGHETEDSDQVLSSAHSLPWHSMDYMGAFGKCYLFFSHMENLYVLDQHAFHERILYERLKSNRKLLKQVQPLLMPESIVLSPTEVECLKEAKLSIEELGFKVAFLSETELEVSSVPDLLKKANLESLLSSLAKSSDLLGIDSDLSILAHDVLSTMACHAAVRAGEELPRPELDFLLHEAEDVDFYHNCPHGRPVVKVFRRQQVEAWFER